MNQGVKGFPFQKSLIGLVLILYVGASLCALFFYGSDVVTTMLRSNSDEFHFLDNIRIMFDELSNFRVKGFLYNCYSFGYGIAYWVLLFLATLPGFLLDNQRLIVFGGRALSLIFSFGTFLLIYFLLKRKLHANLRVITLVLMPSLLNLQLFYFQSVVHPESVYIFFIFLTISFLDKDNGQFSKNFYGAGCAWVLAVSTKALALFSAPLWIIYFLYHRPKFQTVVKLFCMGAASFCIVNLPLLFPLIRIRFVNWLIGMGGRASGESLLFSIKRGFSVLHGNYFNFYVLIGASLVVIFFRMMQKTGSVFLRNTCLKAIFATVFIVYLLLLIYCSCGTATGHYGLPMLYALPVVLAVIYQNIEFFMPRLSRLLQGIVTVIIIPSPMLFLHSMHQVITSVLIPSSLVCSVSDTSVAAYETKKDMDIALQIVNKHFSNAKKRLLIRGNTGFGLIWSTVYMPPIYLSIYDLEDKTLVGADVLMFRVLSQDRVPTPNFFSSKEVRENKIINKFFYKIYDDGRLLIFKRDGL